MSQNETTTVLVTDAKNLTLIDATRENSPWWDDPNPWNNSPFLDRVVEKMV